MSEFHSRDPSTPEFWSERFSAHFTPWDLGGIPAALRQFVAQAPHPYATFIPGCGTGYEVAYLSEAGWDVVAIDFAPTAVAAAQARLGPWGKRVRQADFFSFVPDKPVELIYERAFLCALPRASWPDVVQRWASVLPAGGLLAGFFYFDTAPKGPPFGASSGELEGLLAPWFERVDDQPVSDSLPLFAGKERWQVWRRLP
ncbi:thiopurine S-methyltransferase [Paucimonas lemoignei]|uniref:Thiopurine S-methyltransferase n=1 Tax=Paucimonas lemoignei TaxID=29443 RepID=A0A4R3HXI7_PAULE|nr:methyltransferase domain-containing protein [Paucimonas lemoignei]TCS36991.1 thiopurine S-methyltransferase [Paucimonas lemoignei]